MIRTTETPEESVVAALDRIADAPELNALRDVDPSPCQIGDVAARRAELARNITYRSRHER